VHCGFVLQDSWGKVIYVPLSTFMEKTFGEDRMLKHNVSPVMAPTY